MHRGPGREVRYRNCCVTADSSLSVMNPEPAGAPGEQPPPCRSSVGKSRAVCLARDGPTRAPYHPQPPSTIPKSCSSPSTIPSGPLPCTGIQLHGFFLSFSSPFFWLAIPLLLSRFRSLSFSKPSVPSSPLARSGSTCSPAQGPTSRLPLLVRPPLGHLPSARHCPWHRRRGTTSPN